MNRNLDIALTATAPVIWGSTYIVTTELLPDGYPLTVAMLRALPAGLLLLLMVRRLPHGMWWLKVAVLGALNFSVFWWLLFVSAYALPGGVAATVGAIQPLIVLGLASALLASPLRLGAVLAALGGLAGVALLVLTPEASLDPVGVAAGLGGAVSMAFGTVLTRRWQPDVPALTFTAWQLVAGGLLLLPFALWFEPRLPWPTPANLLGFAHLGLIGAALTYLVWFRGIARLGPSAVSPLGFLSPVTAVLIGWLVLGQQLSPLQMAGFAAVLASVWLSQYVQRPVTASAAPVPSADESRPGRTG